MLRVKDYKLRRRSLSSRLRQISNKTETEPHFFAIHSSVSALPVDTNRWGNVCCKHMCIAATAIL